jgi:hypothetical protein
MRKNAAGMLGLRCTETSVDGYSNINSTGFIIMANNCQQKLSGNKYNFRDTQHIEYFRSFAGCAENPAAATQTETMHFG